MAPNYTPINIAEITKKFQSKKGTNVNTILLLIGTLTAIVLAVMLFVLIQKKMQAQQSDVMPTVIQQPPQVTIAPSPTSIIIVTPTAAATQSAVASPSAALAPLASPSATVTKPATPSATKAP